MPASLEHRKRMLAHLEKRERDMTNHDFAMRTAQIAKRAASWTHDTLTMGRDYLDKPTNDQAAAVFCKSIKEMLDALHPLSRDGN